MVAAAAAGVVAVRELNCIITWLSFFPLMGIRQYNNKMASLQTVDIIHKHTHTVLLVDRHFLLATTRIAFSPKKIYIDKLNFSRKLMRTKLVCMYIYQKNMIEFGTRCNCLTGWVSAVWYIEPLWNHFNQIHNSKFKIHIPTFSIRVSFWEFRYFAIHISLKVDEILARVT